MKNERSTTVYDKYFCFNVFSDMSLEINETESKNNLIVPARKAVRMSMETSPALISLIIKSSNEHVDVIEEVPQPNSIFVFLTVQSWIKAKGIFKIN